MGDADNDVVVPEIEALMDEALAVDGLVNFLTLVTELNERTKGILMELKILESFRKIFIALNFFIVPVVIAIMVCYGTKESVSSNTSGFQAGLQMAVMFLMFMASTVGLPFYIISVWESYWMTQNINEEPNIQNPFSHSNLLNDSMMTLLTNESSLERFHEFDHLLNDQIQHRIRENLLRRRSADTDYSEQRMEDSSEMEMESAVTEASSSVETSEGKQDEYPTSSEGKQKGVEFPILYQFKVLMNELSPDLAVRFEPVKKGETTEDGKTGEQTAIESNLSQKDSLSNAESNEVKDASAVVTYPELHICNDGSLLSQNQQPNPEISD